jgi:hypothetical protein
MFHSGSWLDSSKVNHILLCVRGRKLVFLCSTLITVPVADPVRVNPASLVCLISLGSSLLENTSIHACAHTTNCTFDEDTVNNSGFMGDGTPF